MSKRKRSSVDNRKPDHERSQLERRPPWKLSWAVALILFSTFFVLLLWPLFSRDCEPRWDARDLFHPSFVYVADSIQEGRFPLWDPYTSCGYPFHADPNNPTLNPVALVIALTVDNTPLGFILYWAFFWWLGGAGMLWITREFGATPTGGLLAAVTYCFSGFFIGHAEHTSFIPVAGLFPWIIAFADAALQKQKLAYAGLSGCCLGLASLGGYPMLVSVTGLATGIWLVLRLCFRGSMDKDTLRTLLRSALLTGAILAIIALFAAAIWSPVLNAFFREGAEYTDRAKPLPPEMANFGDPFSLPAMISLFFPYATIVAAGKMGADISMTNGYAGILTVPLAIYWFLAGDRKRRPWWLLGFLLFMFVLTLGGKAGLRSLLYHVFPPLQYGRFSSIFRVYWIFALCLAAGLGCSHLLSDSGNRKYALYAIAAWTGLSLISYPLMRHFLGLHGIVRASVGTRLLFPAAVILPLGFLLFGLFQTGRTVGPPVMAILTLLLVHVDAAWHFRNNMETVCVPRDSIRRAEMYHRRTTQIAGEPGPRHPPGTFHYFNVQQIIKEPVVQGFTGMRAKGFDEVLCNSRFAEVLTSPVRYWISPGAEKAASEDDAIRILSGIGRGNAVPAFLKEVPSGLHAERAVPGGYGNTRITLYEPERIEMEVEIPAPTPGILASTERYARGWQASVDGLPAEVVPVNVFFRGIRVPPGIHHVTWEYKPYLWKPLVALSIAAQLCGISGSIVILRRRKGTSPKSA